MDGHGVAGRQASNFVKNQLSSHLLKEEKLETDPKTVLRQNFFKVHRELQVRFSFAGRAALKKNFLGNFFSFFP
jgi:hypothetical protein